MNPIQELKRKIRSEFPNLKVKMDAASTAKGPWFLDVHRGDGAPLIVIEWRSDWGFGISTPDGSDFGMKPDELYSNVKTALQRVAELVHHEANTIPPRPAKLAELRTFLGLTQAELAERIGVKQANISRIESREDIRLSTLATLVKAMGGHMTITVTLPNGTTVPLDLSPFGIEMSEQLPTP